MFWEGPSPLGPNQTNRNRFYPLKAAGYQKAALRVIEISQFVGTPAGDALTRIFHKLDHYPVPQTPLSALHLQTEVLTLISVAQA
jgi:hypothetical protein